MSPGNYELPEDASVYRVVTADADTIEYAGQEVASVAASAFSGEEFIRYSGRGAVFSDGQICGVLNDGTVKAIPYEEVRLLEVDLSDTGRTVLLTTGAVVASGFLIYVLANGMMTADPVPPES